MKRFLIPLVSLLALVVFALTRAAPPPPIYPGTVPYQQLDTRNFELADYPVLRVMPFMARGAPPYLAVDTWSFAVDTNWWRLYGFNPLDNTWHGVNTNLNSAWLWNTYLMYSTITNLIVYNMSIVQGGVTNVAGLWINDAGTLRPTGTNPIYAVWVTNLMSMVSLNAGGEFNTFPWQAVNLVPGTNQVNITGHSVIYVTGTGTNCVMQLNQQGAGKHIWIINATNSTFTMHNMPSWDAPSWIQTFRGGIWIPSEAGETLGMLGHTNEVVEVMRVNPRGGAASSVLNPTPNYSPYNQGGTNFGDSHWYYTATGMGIDTNIYFGPGTTNVIYRDGTDLVYTNGVLAGQPVSLKLVDGAGASAEFSVLGNVAQVKPGTGGNSVDLNDRTRTLRFSGGRLWPLSAGVDLGGVYTSTDTAWHNIEADGTNFVYGYHDNTFTNPVDLAVSVTGSTAIFDIQSITNNVLGPVTGYSFRTNGVEIASFSAVGGTNAGWNWDSVNKLMLGGTGATATRATNEFVFGSANDLYTFPGTAKFSTGGGSNSVDSVVLISRAVNALGTGNGHAFSDSSDVSRPGGVAYNSYDARITTSGADGLEHYCAFQANPNFGSSGHVTNFYAFGSSPVVSAGAVENLYGFYLTDPTGAGVVSNLVGLYIPALTKGVVQNYSIFVSNKAWFGADLLSAGPFELGTTKLMKITPNFGGVGEIPAGVLISGYTGVGSGDGITITASGSGTAGAKTVIAYKGAAYDSALEIANVAAGYGDLLLMKSGGRVGILTNAPSEALEVLGNIKASGRALLKGGIQDGYTNVLTSATGKDFFYVSVPNTNGIGGHVVYTVFATDGTDVQEISGDVKFAAVAKSTTVTASTADVQAPAVVTGGSTLTAALAANVATNNVFALGVTATTSLTTTNLVIKWRVETPSTFTVNAIP